MIKIIEKVNLNLHSLKVTFVLFWKKTGRVHCQFVICSRRRDTTTNNYVFCLPTKYFKVGTYLVILE